MTPKTATTTVAKRVQYQYSERMAVWYPRYRRGRALASPRASGLRIRTDPRRSQHDRCDPSLSVREARENFRVAGLGQIGAWDDRRPLPQRFPIDRKHFGVSSSPAPQKNYRV